MNKLKLISNDKTYIAFEELKTCVTCGHKMLGQCNLSGHNIKTERMYPTVCGVSFEGWIPKPKKIGLLKFIRNIFIGEA